MNFAITAPQQTQPPVPAAADAKSAEHRKLTDAAQQFEGMLLQEMLKPMKEHGFGQQDGDDDDKDKDGGGFGDTLSSFGAETMATAISKAGGLGIAKHIVSQVEAEKSSHTRSAAAGTGDLKLRK